MNIDVVGKFYLGNGGIGDALLFLSTFYDEVDSANIIFLANQPSAVKELFDCFPKIERKLIIQNDFTWLKEFYGHPNCLGTGIIPKNLDYSAWYKANPFTDYGVKEFPEFMNLFEPIKVDPSKQQLFVQYQGSNIEGEGKWRRLGRNTLIETQKLIDSEKYHYIGGEDTLYNHKPLKRVIQEIRGSDLVISVDSFAKTVSAMSKIKTIVYDNMYSVEYLDRFKDKIDYGHYIFLFGWKYIEFRPQL